MKTLKIFLFALLMIAFSTLTFAQNDDEIGEAEDDIENTDTQKPEREKKERNPAWDRMFFGGNAMINFWNTNSFVYLSPRVGYRFTDMFSAGVGATYMNISFNNNARNFGGTPISNSIYGGNIFGRLNLTEQFFAQTELELLSVENIETFDIRNDRALISSLFVGGGYSFRIGQRSFVNTMVLYNPFFTNTPNNPYSSPIDFRIGIQL